MKMTIAIAVEMITALQNRIEDLERQSLSGSNSNRDRGPKSSRDMTIDDARRIMLGDLVSLSHKAAAEKLGLSYGQIYSARGGYTFKSVTDEKLENSKMKVLSRDK